MPLITPQFAPQKLPHNLQGALWMRFTYTYSFISEKISNILLQRPVQLPYLLGLFICAALALYFIAAVIYLLGVGVGIWGINIPVAWGIAIINYVWWIEIAMGGTFISTALFVTNQYIWRTTIYRFAEIMMLCAWILAGVYPLLHMGRPWFWYWLVPYTNTMALYPQFHSALFWDVVALLAYGLVAVMFFFTGLIPDFATLRDRATTQRQRTIFGTLALGWVGSSKQWAIHKQAYVIMAALTLTIVFTVHSVVALDFATTVLPGWNDPFFPPYFVAEAIYSGLSMALVLGIPLRAAFKLHDLIPIKNLEIIAKLQLVTANIILYTYVMSIFMGLYSDRQPDVAEIHFRLFGLYGFLFWIATGILCVLAQLLWFKKIRTNTLALFFLSLLFQIGMWIERYYVVINSLAHSYVPSMNHFYNGTYWDYSMFIGTIGIFILLFLLLIRAVPMVSISESLELLHIEGDDLNEKWKQS